MLHGPHHRTEPPLMRQHPFSRPDILDTFIPPVRHHQRPGLKAGEPEAPRIRIRNLFRRQLRHILRLPFPLRVIHGLIGSPRKLIILTIPNAFMPGPFQPQPEPADSRTDIQKCKPSHGQSTSPFFSLPLPSGSRTTLLSTSFPHASQPGTRCLANSSTLGRSPINSTIFSLVSSGFLLCASSGEMINWWTRADLRLGCPLTPSRQISAFPLVQNPRP